MSRFMMKRDFFINENRIKYKKKMIDVAIQGEKGSFHDIAAHRYFDRDDINLSCYGTFEQVFAHVQQHPEAVALVAIENTIAGSLLHNYELLRNSGLTVVGEHKLRISHSIMCLPEDDWADIREVNSHPVALMQCRDFLGQHPDFKVVEVADTAGAAENIWRKQLHGHAAICHRDVARIYGMKVLLEGIETNKHNFTRFLVLAHSNGADRQREACRTNKASLEFTLPHEQGSLSAILSILSFYKLNLTKIQSLPIIGKEWQYMFYVDLTFDNPDHYKQAISAISPLTQELNLLGEYTNGRQSI